MIRYNSNKSLQKFRYQSCFSLFVLNLTWKKSWIKLMFSQFQAFPILWMLPWAPRVDENSRYEKAKIFFIRCNAAAIFSFQPFLQFFVICSVFRKDSLRYKWFRSNQICVSVIQDIFQWRITFFCCVCALKESKNIFFSTNIFKLSYQFSSQDGWPSNRVFRRVCPPVYAGSRRKGDESRIGQAFQIMVRANLFRFLAWIL